MFVFLCADLYPDLFTDSELFDKGFDLVREAFDANLLWSAQELMKPIMLRRLKKEVSHKLPPKTETRILCPLAPYQVFWYKRLLSFQSSILNSAEASAAAEEEEAKKKADGTLVSVSSSSSSDTAAAVPATPASTGSSNEWTKLMSLMMQLRKCCLHPYLFPGAEPEGGADPRERVKASGKLSTLDKLLVRLKRDGHRVLIFSSFTSMLDILEVYTHTLHLWHASANNRIDIGCSFVHVCIPF
jgi:SWI/SNF-related matrix-associated actin-dependent regulator of chromatin subfamily A member 5